MRGFFRAVDGQISIEKFFTGRAYFRARGYCIFELPEDARQEIARGFCGDERKTANFINKWFVVLGARLATLKEAAGI